MTVENHTLRLLQEIRSEIETNRNGIEANRKAIEANAVAIGRGLNHASEERSALLQHLRHMEIRISTEIKDVAGAVLELKGLVVQNSAVRARVDDHETRIRDLEDK